eukprot:Hpha_TRINITY_DN15892_c0_g5::TRINITY_DN15892_c0_g5_i1::g.187286::m.187286
MPKRVGKYELGEFLGSGDFSKVKAGVDVESGAKYAVKIGDKAKGHVEQQLKREIAIMKLLNHPHVLSMVDVLQTGSNIYLVLELLTGGDLLDKLEQVKRFEEPQARTYFQQLVYGLQYLHANDIAPCDLKPENLLLDAGGNLKIADFGFSRLLNNQQLLQTVQARPTAWPEDVSTPNCMAPEVLEEQGYDGKKADLWSSGVILYTMMAGYLPFDDENMNVLCDNIKAGEYRMSRKFSDQARDITERLLTVNPYKRIDMAGICAHAFFTPGANKDLLNGKRVEPSQEQTENAVVTAEEAG